MKKLFILFPILFLSVFSYAQYTHGDRDMSPPTQEDGRPPMRKGGTRKMMFNSIAEDIPELSLEQREKLSTLLSKENEKIKQQIDKKREIEHVDPANLSDKQKDKNKKKINKIDEKIEKMKSDTNKKVKKVLNEEQYNIYLEKREQIKFGPKTSHQIPPQPDGERPRRQEIE